MYVVPRPRVPEGLRGLVKDLAREILKGKPVDIYDFAGNYFHALLPEKENYSVTDFEHSEKYDFSHVKHPQRFQLPVALAYSIIPEELTNLIKELIKAVLREQPQNLIEFAVEYFRYINNSANRESEAVTREINYTSYENYFRKEERFLFTANIKCTCGRTLNDLTYTNSVKTGEFNKHQISESAIQTKCLSDVDENDAHYSTRHMTAICKIQNCFRRYLRGKNCAAKSNKLKSENEADPLEKCDITNMAAHRLEISSTELEKYSEEKSSTNKINECEKDVENYILHAHQTPLKMEKNQTTNDLLKNTENVAETNKSGTTNKNEDFCVILNQQQVAANNSDAEGLSQSKAANKERSESRNLEKENHRADSFLAESLSEPVSNLNSETKHLGQENKNECNANSSAEREIQHTDSQDTALLNSKENSADSKGLILVVHPDHNDLLDKTEIKSLEKENVEEKSSPKTSNCSETTVKDKIIGTQEIQMKEKSVKNDFEMDSKTSRVIDRGIEVMPHKSFLEDDTKYSLKNSNTKTYIENGHELESVRNESGAAFEDEALELSQETENVRNTSDALNDELKDEANGLKDAILHFKTKRNSDETESATCEDEIDLREQIKCHLLPFNNFIEQNLDLQLNIEPQLHETDQSAEGLKAEGETPDVEKSELLKSCKDSSYAKSYKNNAVAEAADEQQSTELVQKGNNAGRADMHQKDHQETTSAALDDCHANSLQATSNLELKKNANDIEGANKQNDDEKAVNTTNEKLQGKQNLLVTNNEDSCEIQANKTKNHDNGKFFQEKNELKFEDLKPEGIINNADITTNSIKENAAVDKYKENIDLGKRDEVFLRDLGNRSSTSNRESSEGDQTDGKILQVKENETDITSNIPILQMVTVDKKTICDATKEYFVDGSTNPAITSPNNKSMTETNEEVISEEKHDIGTSETQADSIVSEAPNSADRNVNFQIKETKCESVQISSYDEIEPKTNALTAFSGKNIDKTEEAEENDVKDQDFPVEKRKCNTKESTKKASAKTMAKSINVHEEECKGNISVAPTESIVNEAQDTSSSNEVSQLFDVLGSNQKNNANLQNNKTECNEKTDGASPHKVKNSTDTEFPLAEVSVNLNDENKGNITDLPENDFAIERQTKQNDISDVRINQDKVKGTISVTNDFVSLVENTEKLQSKGISNVDQMMKFTESRSQNNFPKNLIEESEKGSEFGNNEPEHKETSPHLMGTKEATDELARSESNQMQDKKEDFVVKTEAILEVKQTNALTPTQDSVAKMTNQAAVNDEIAETKQEEKIYNESANNAAFNNKSLKIEKPSENEEHFLENIRNNEDSNPLTTKYNSEILMDTQSMTSLKMLKSLEHTAAELPNSIANICEHVSTKTSDESNQQTDSLKENEEIKNLDSVGFDEAPIENLSKSVPEKEATDTSFNTSNNVNANTKEGNDAIGRQILMAENKTQEKRDESVGENLIETSELQAKEFECLHDREDHAWKGSEDPRLKTRLEEENIIETATDKTDIKKTIKRQENVLQQSVSDEKFEENTKESDHVEKQNQCSEENAIFPFDVNGLKNKTSSDLSSNPKANEPSQSGNSNMEPPQQEQDTSSPTFRVNKTTDHTEVNEATTCMDNITALSLQTQFVNPRDNEPSNIRVKQENTNYTTETPGQHASLSHQNTNLDLIPLIASSESGPDGNVKNFRTSSKTIILAPSMETNNTSVYSGEECRLEAKENENAIDLARCDKNATPFMQQLDKDMSQGVEQMVSVGRSANSADTEDTHDNKSQLKVLNNTSQVTQASKSGNEVQQHKETLNNKGPIQIQNEKSVSIPENLSEQQVAASNMAKHQEITEEEVQKYNDVPISEQNINESAQNSVYGQTDMQKPNTDLANVTTFQTKEANILKDRDEKEFADQTESQISDQLNEEAEYDKQNEQLTNSSRASKQERLNVHGDSKPQCEKDATTDNFLYETKEQILHSERVQDASTVIEQVDSNPKSPTEVRSILNNEAANENKIICLPDKHTINAHETTANGQENNDDPTSGNMENSSILQKFEAHANTNVNVTVPKAHTDNEQNTYLQLRPDNENGDPAIGTIESSGLFEIHGDTNQYVSIPKVNADADDEYNTKYSAIDKVSVKQSNDADVEYSTALHQIQPGSSSYSDTHDSENQDRLRDSDLDKDIAFDIKTNIIKRLAASAAVQKVQHESSCDTNIRFASQESLVNVNGDNLQTATDRKPILNEDGEKLSAQAKSETLCIGTQNLTLGRNRIFNEGLIGSISGQRFAETHLRSFWKEYVMNNSEPLSEYKYLENEQNQLGKQERNCDLHSEAIPPEQVFRAENKLNMEDAVFHRENGSHDKSQPEHSERLPSYFYGALDTTEHTKSAKTKSYKQPTSFTIPFGDFNRSNLAQILESEHTCSPNCKTILAKFNETDNFTNFNLTGAAYDATISNKAMPRDLCKDSNDREGGSLNIDADNNLEYNNPKDELLINSKPGLQTIDEHNECELYRPVSFLPPSDDELLENIEKISESEGTSWSTESKEENSFLDEFLEDPNNNEYKTDTPCRLNGKSKPQGGIYEFFSNHDSEPDLNKVFVQAPSPLDTESFESSKNTNSTNREIFKEECKEIETNMYSKSESRSTTSGVCQVASTEQVSTKEYNASLEEEFKSNENNEVGLNCASEVENLKDLAARRIQKALRKFLKRKSNIEIKKTSWFIGDQQIIANDSLTKPISEIPFEETEAYIELTNNPSQCLVSSSSSVESTDASNFCRHPTAPAPQLSISCTGLASNCLNSANTDEVLAGHSEQDGKTDNFHTILDGNDTAIAHYSKAEKEEGDCLQKTKKTNAIEELSTSKSHCSQAADQDNSKVNILKSAAFAAPNVEEISKLLSNIVNANDECTKEPHNMKTAPSSCVTENEEVHVTDTSSLSEADDTDDVVIRQAAKLRKPDATISKMQQRRDSTSKVSSLENPKDYSFDEPCISKSLDTDEEAGLVVKKLLREETVESSTQSDNTDVVVTTDDCKQPIKSSAVENLIPLRGSLKRVYTIAGESDAKLLYKNVTIDEYIKYIEPPDFEVTGGNISLDMETKENILRQMMAFSLSEAESDCFDKCADNGNITARISGDKYDDFNVVTALIENDNSSTETDSTIVSAVTKIQAGARGYLTRKRLERTSAADTCRATTLNESKQISFGNAAMSESLENLVKESAARRLQKFYRAYLKQRSVQTNQRQKEICSSEITPGHENVLTLHNASPEIGKGSANKSKNSSTSTNTQVNEAEMPSSWPENKNAIGNRSTSEYLLWQTAKTTADAKQIKDQKLKWFSKRQNSMPVQIDSEVLRVIPKYMRKKVKSAGGVRKTIGRQMFKN